MIVVGIVLSLLIIGGTVGGVAYVRYLTETLRLRLQHEREMWLMRERANYTRDLKGLQQAAYEAPDPYEKGPV